ncbi:MAG: tetratricopeptide repeat protein, partial [Sphaerochaetaceae bacterium]|nr:tetratricopeptide repeat protein [Sphaerochaetaceae bacterium]
MESRSEIAFKKASYLVNLKKYNKALEYFDKAISLAPNRINYQRDKGNVLQMLGRYEEAIDIYNHALIINPNDISLFNSIG